MFLEMMYIVPNQNDGFMVYVGTINLYIRSYILKTGQHCLVV